MSPACAGRPSTGIELGDGALQRLELRGDRLLRHLGLVLRHLELRPVGRLGLRLHLDGGREAPVLALARGQLVVELRLRDGVDAGARGGVPEPAADVALDRLGEETLLPDALHRGSAAAPCPCGSRGCARVAARSLAACSTAWCTSCAGTSTVSLTLSSASCSTVWAIGKPLDQTGTFSRRGRRERDSRAEDHEAVRRASPSTRRTLRELLELALHRPEPPADPAVAIPRARPGDPAPPGRASAATRRR